MRLLNRTAVLFLSLALLLTAIPAPAQASTPLRIDSIWPILGYQELGVPATPLDPGVTGFTLLWYEPVDLTTIPGAVTLTSATETLHVETTSTVADQRISLKLSAPLQPETAYTLHIKGGAEGVRAKSGNLLPEEITYPFTTAPAEPQIVRAYWVAPDGTKTPVEAGGTIPRSLFGLTLVLSKAVSNQFLRNYITITDHADNLVPTAQGDLWVENNRQEVEIQFPKTYGYAPTPLPANESYTIRIKGGADGLGMVSGGTLPTDLTFQVRTASTPMPTATAVTSALTKYSTPNISEVYDLTAKAGPLTLKLDHQKTALPMRISLLDSTGKLLFSQNYARQGYWEERIDLPTDGRYTLLFSPNTLDNLTVVANDLVMDATMPVIKPLVLGGLQNRTKPFTISPELFNPTEVGQVAVTLGDRLLFQGAQFDPNNPITVDPTGLPDGLYPLLVAAKASTSENGAVSGSFVLVDKQPAFSDTATSWARAPIEAMAHLGIIKGRGTGLYEPAASISRAEFAKLLVQTFGLKEPANTADFPFEDVKDDWAKPYIQTLAKLGYTQGVYVRQGDMGWSYFYPDRPISRAEAVALIGRLIGVTDLNPNLGGRFTDWNEVPTWARSAVYVLVVTGKVNGLPDGRFAPARSIRRDEAAQLLGGFLAF